VLVPLLALSVAAALFECRGPSVPRSPSTPTPVLAARLRPVPAWTAAQRAHLRTTLDDAFVPAIAGASGWSLAVLSADGRTLYANRAWDAVTPASTQKLIVASAALAELGPHFRYHTEMLGERTVDSDGALHGDLWLAGSGDPSVRSPDLRAGVAHLATDGLRRIDGGIVVDATIIKPPEINVLWNADDANEDFEAPISGISLDEDTVEFHVIGTAVGRPAAVAFTPASAAVRFSGQVLASVQGDDVIVASTGTPNEFVVSGEIPAGVEEKFWVPVHGIARYAGAVLERMFAQAHVGLGASARVGATPLDATILWDHRSQPLGDLVARMLYVSDNHYAEQFLRTMGALVAGAGDDASGLQVERTFLSRQRIPTPGLHLVDGSGLAHADRVAAITLATILSDAQIGDPAAALYGRLPQGGRQGTLKEYDFTTALGRVRAKSGHLYGVGALAGYVNTYHHGRVVFAFLIDGSPDDADAAIVRAVDRLATL
jgi:D-alanyl-D-alanine carboxypeptidase/D-alanyl-D-alanine-endopeptidase (penicillin-binding protein 4)